MENIYRFYQKLLKLKKIKRRGWIRRNVKNSESDADHSWGMALLGYFFAKKLNLDVQKVMIMGLLHEVCEIEVGDITPADNVPKDEKNEMETNAARSILNEFDPSGELFELWLDFENRRTPEGILANQLDKLEMMFQVWDYEKEQDLVMNNFYETMEERIKQGLYSDEILKYYREMQKERNEKIL